MKVVITSVAVTVCGLFLGYSVQASSNSDWLESVPYVFDGPSSEWGCKASSWKSDPYDFDDPMVPHVSGWGCSEQQGDIGFLRGSYRTTPTGVNNEYGVYAIKSAKTGDVMTPLYLKEEEHYFITEGASVAVEQTKNTYGTYETYIYKNIDDSIYPSYSKDGKPREMRFDWVTNLKYANGYPISSAASSSNKSHIVAKHYDRDSQRGWIVKIDSKTADTEEISIDGAGDEVIAVSNDGRYVIVGRDIYDTKSCLDDGEDRKCQHASLAKMIAERGSYAYVSGFENVSFSQNDQQIYMLALVMRHGDDMGRIEPLTLSQHMQLDYLALGDSYTSGEGDIGRDSNYENFYTKSTKVGCHLSTRSYPYLLSEAWGFSSPYSKSVACSGALLDADYSSNINTYDGQRNELKTGNRETKIEDALLNYLPGFVPQLEFVKRYQPKVVTITGGGNDVGFAEVLSYCAGDIEALVLPYTCEYVEGKPLNSLLNDSIDSQYKVIEDFIEDIKAVSPTTKIYFIGYPSFIGGSQSNCYLNNGILEGAERDMINTALNRLNGVIERASLAKGIKYVDIEGSLDSGRLCEGSEYVTGVADVGLINMQNPNLRAQAFHPNAKGHEKIARTIEAAVLDPLTTKETAPRQSSDLKPTIPTYSVKIIETTQIDEGGMITFNLAPGTTQGRSTVYAVGFSTPVDLGTHTSNEDGSLHASARLSKEMEPGQHLLVLGIVNPNGEKNRLFQFFQIIRRNIVAEKSKNVDMATKKATVDKDLSSPNGVLNLNVDNSPEEGSNKPPFAIQNNPVSNLAWLGDRKNIAVNGNKNGQLYLLAAILLVTIGGVWAYVKKSKN